jgi:hypothetical protein
MEPVARPELEILQDRLARIAERMFDSAGQLESVLNRMGAPHAQRPPMGECPVTPESPAFIARMYRMLEAHERTADRLEEHVERFNMVV